MRTTRRMWIAAAAFTTAAFSTPALSQATVTASAPVGEIGWLDGVEVDMVDTAYGWVCENEDAFRTAAYGSIDVFLDGPAGFGIYYGNFPLNSTNWGYFKDGVNAAGYCGTNPYVAFRLSGWFADEEGGSPNTIYLYWRDAAGHLTKIGGSPLQMSQIGMNGMNP